MRVHVARCAVGLLLVWGCSGSTSYFEEEAGGGSGKGGTGQGGSAQGGTTGSGGTGTGGASGGTGGATGGRGGTGGASGGSGGSQGGEGAQGGDGAVGGRGAEGGAAGSPVGGAAGAGGSGQAGGGAAGMACTDPDASGGRGDGSTVQSTTTGTNGSFDDACDAKGNLVEYGCELGPCVSARIALPTAGRGGFPVGGAGGVAACPTGRVIPRTIDCGGHCDDGACFGWCAEQGGKFEVTGLAGTMLEMSQGSFHYSCSVAFEREGYDCLGDELVGRTMVVTSLGACTGGSTTFGWDDPESPSIEECAFTCTLS